MTAKEKVENLLAQLKEFEDADIEHSQTAIEVCVLEEVYKWMLEDEQQEEHGALFAEGFFLSEEEKDRRTWNP